MPAKKVDPDLPLAVSGEAALTQPPYWPAELKGNEATMSGSIHSPMGQGVFFKHHDFLKAEHDGRLYYVHFLSRDQQGRKGNLSFVKWTPLDGAEMAQRLTLIPGHAIEDYQTDGKVLRVHHYPPWPALEPTRIQTYGWKGDDSGHGKFVLEGTKDGPPPPW
jgi:hypothetical protein